MFEERRQLAFAMQDHALRNCEQAGGQNLLSSSVVQTLLWEEKCEANWAFHDS
jgi:hypothetical protein